MKNYTDVKDSYLVKTQLSCDCFLYPKLNQKAKCA